jgi:hypothetical protein
MIEDLSFSSIVEISGNNPQTNTYSSLRIIQDSLLNGQIGSGLVFQDSLFINSFAASLQVDSVFMGPYSFNFSPAFYKAELRIFSDSINETPQEATRNFYFVITDSLMDKGNGEIQGTMGTHSYTSGQSQNGKVLATSYAVEGSDSVELKSISIYSVLSPGSDSIAIKPVVWLIDPSDSSFSFYGDNPIPTFIDQSINSKWVNLDFGTNPVWLKKGKLYAIGWQQISSKIPNKSFVSGRYFSMERFQPDYSTFIGFPNDSTWQNLTWGWVTSLPAIRLNVGTISSRINEQSKPRTSFTVEAFPNPNDGLFTLNYKLDSRQNIKIIIFNTLGEKVYTERIGIDKAGKREINLSKLSNGLYYVSIKAGDSQIVKKVLLQR